MVSLILNENMKLYRRIRTWVMVVLMIGAVLLGSFMEWHYDDKSMQGDGWRTEIADEQRQMQQGLSSTDMGDDTKRYYQDQIMINDYRLEHDIRPTSGTMWDGINGSAELIVLITLFTVIIAGDSLAGEFATGTIKLLLIRPASRFKIWLAKYLSLILFSLMLLCILFVVSVLFNGLLYGFGWMNLPLLEVNGSGQVAEYNMVANLWKTYLLNGVSTIIFVSMAFMISSAFRSSTMAIGISIAALFAGAILMELLQAYDWSRYLLFANIDLSQHLSGRPYQEGMTLSFSIIVLAIHFAVFNLVSWFVFTRRDVAA